MEWLAEEKTPVTVGNSFVSLCSLPIRFANILQAIQTPSITSLWLPGRSQGGPSSHHGPGVLVRKQVVGQGWGAREALASLCSPCPSPLMPCNLPLGWAHLGTQS